jgi:hypothetical protein
MAALENVGLAITSLREPVPDTADKGSHIERWKRVPLYPMAEGKVAANLISSSKLNYDRVRCFPIALRG